MVPLYAALVSDLGPGDFMHVECACGHTERLTAAMLITAGVARDEKVQRPGNRMRCRECDEKGQAVISISFEKEAEAALGLPPDWHSYALIPIGYLLGRFGPVR